MSDLQRFWEHASAELLTTGVEWGAFAVTMVLPLLLGNLTARTFFPATTKRMLWIAALYGWLGSLASFFVWQVVCFAIVGAHRPLSQPDWMDWFLGSLLIGGVTCLVTSVVYCARHANREPIAEQSTERSWRVGLRTVIACQVIFAIAIGMATVAIRRQLRMEDEQQRANVKQRWADERFQPYGWEPALMPTGSGDRLSLHRVHDQSRFQSAGLRLIEPADQIVYLHVQSHNLTDDDLRFIGSLKTLERLVIDSNSITAAGVAEFAKLPALRELTLETRNLGEAGLAGLAQAPELHTVRLVDDGIIDTHLQALATAPKLRRLHLESKGITDISFDHLRKFQRLEDLTLLNSQVTRAAALKFQADRPDVWGWFNQADDKYYQ